MNSNELREYVQELNKKEQIEHELKRQKALKRIRELRAELKYKIEKETKNGNSIRERI